MLQVLIYKIQIQMEANYQKLVLELSARDKHIIQLQSQMLRIDYQYAKIVKDLKLQYSHIVKLYNDSETMCRQLKRQIKKLQSIIASKNRQNEKLFAENQNSQAKLSFNDEVCKRVQLQNQTLKKEIRHLQNNQNKYNIKAQQALHKKQLSDQECFKLQQKIQILTKQIKKTKIKTKQLQQLVEQEMLETKQRVFNIGSQLLSKQYENTKKNIYAIQQELFKQTKPTFMNNPQQQFNDWQSDMKKLKNCIDYGQNFILVFDPMNLDRAVSREIFKSLKKCFKQSEQLKQQLQKLQENNFKIANDHKKALEYFQQEIRQLSEERSKKIMISTQTQTQNINFNDPERVLSHWNQLNTKLKIKNKTLIQCLDLVCLRNVVCELLLKNAYQNAKYFKKFIKCQSKVNGKVQQAGRFKRFKTCALAVVSIFIMKKIAKESAKFKTNYSKCNDKIKMQTFRLQNVGIKNIELERLKNILIIQEDSLYTINEQFISYYKFKLKDSLQMKLI